MPAYADRIASIPRSFIREILKVTAQPDVISFAGGLPNPAFFPVEEIRAATDRVLREEGSRVLQYSTTEGYQPLREWIAARYAKTSALAVSPDEIVITTGSQQGLDLASKVFLNAGDGVIVERPGYIGAIQCFGVFQPRFIEVALAHDGPEIDQLEHALRDDDAKLFYAVPTFQNPSGATWSEHKRRAAAKLMDNADVVFVEDNPYGELRFEGAHPPAIYGLTGARRILLGSFSKTAAPGFRIGWMVTDPQIRHHLVTCKQAADLHASTFDQAVIYRWLADFDFDAHVARIIDAYRKQRDLMVELLRAHFPPEARFASPEGGMFLWVELPPGCDALDLFHLAIKEKVAFVPGRPFFALGGGANTLRLNFSNSDQARLETGMARLGKCLKDYLAQKSGRDSAVAM